MQAVLEVCAADRRRRVSTQGQRTGAPVLEGVHLLLDDNGARAGGAREELGLFKDRRLDPPIAVERAQTLDLARDQLAAGLFGRQDVVGPARRLEFAAHEARSSARNGLVASSAPSVVSSP